MNDILVFIFHSLSHHQTNFCNKIVFLFFPQNFLILMGQIELIVPQNNRTTEYKAGTAITIPKGMIFPHLFQFYTFILLANRND